MFKMQEIRTGSSINPKLAIKCLEFEFDVQMLSQILIKNNRTCFQVWSGCIYYFLMDNCNLDESIASHSWFKSLLLYIRVTSFVKLSCRQPLLEWGHRWDLRNYSPRCNYDPLQYTFVIKITDAWKWSCVWFKCLELYPTLVSWQTLGTLGFSKY